MSVKRKRAAAQASHGLAAGERLKRHKLASVSESPWGWVGTEIKDAPNISEEHLLATCGFARNSSGAFCPNKYAKAASKQAEPSTSSIEEPVADGELADDVIVISSDSESANCSKKGCRKRQNCVNYVGQEKWENKGVSFPCDVIQNIILTGIFRQRCQRLLSGSSAGTRPSASEQGRRPSGGTAGACGTSCSRYIAEIGFASV